MRGPKSVPGHMLPLHHPFLPLSLLCAVVPCLEDWCGLSGTSENKAILLLEAGFCRVPQTAAIAFPVHPDQCL
jgi:hypothetical protein